MKVVYPGMFDPPTYGHLDIIKRAIELFGEVLIFVAENSMKNPLFSAQERIDMLKEITRDIKGVSVSSFSGLLVDEIQKRGIKIVVRGLRAISDFEFEFQMALTNKKMYPELETVFLMTDESHFYLSSSVVKELAELHRYLECFVPEQVLVKLKEKFNG
ncbi:TPA: pantetheine-phosphate adenylyltransferase [bacterium]|nr:pantetheine-phosphate adenylyltransferase [bacterium]